MAPAVTEEQRPRTALVAGGTGGLGRAVVEALLARGESVCVPWRTERDAVALREAHPDALSQGRLRLSQCDVADHDQVAALLDVLQADWGPLWLACSAVGAWAGGTPVADLHDLTVLDRMLHVNLRSAFVVAHEGLRHMGREGGRIVLVGSRTAQRPAAGQAAYSAAKAALESLVATLALELRGTGVTVNAVVPGVIATAANAGALPDEVLARAVPPWAIAAVIAWLGTVESWPVSGAALPVAGDS